MPTINLPEKKRYNEDKRKASDKRDNLIHKHVYNTSRWKDLRLNYLSTHPLCNVCLNEKNIVRSATEVHHVTPISKAGQNVQKILELGFNPLNLEALCTECHKEKHKSKI